MFPRICWVLLSCAIAGALPGLAEDDSGESPLDREKWFLHQRVDKEGHIAAAARLRALAKREKLQAAGDVAYPSQNWQSIGPQPETNYGVNSGRVTALAVDPRNSQVAYAGAAGGGIWKTLDAGVHWMPLTDAQVSLSTGSIALDPEQPDTVYVGTGEANYSIDSYFGSGILKSTDGGMTWTNYQGPFVGSFIGQLAVSPTNSNVVLAAALGGIYRSIDGGVTWLPVLSAAVASSVVFSPGSGEVAWAGVANPAFSDPNAGLYKSSDGGQTWIAVTVAPLPAANLMGRIAIAIAPSNPQVLYVGISGIMPSDSTTLGLFDSVDGGATWNANTKVNYQGDWYRNTLAVSPLNPQVLLGGGIDLSRSLDGNATWSDAGGVAIHVDQHALAFSADGSLLYIGNDGGVFTTPTYAAALPGWNSTNNTLALTQFYPGVAAHPTDVTVTVAGTQDNGTLVYSGTPAWGYAGCGDGGGAAIDPVNPLNVYITCEKDGLYKSSGGPIQADFQLAMGAIPQSEVPFVGIVNLDPTNPNTVYFGGNTGIWRSTDGAVSWLEVSASVTPAPAATTAIGVGSTDGKVVFFSDEDGYVNCTADITAARVVWTECDSDLEFTPIQQFVLDPRQPTSAYAVAPEYGSGHVFHTANGGINWTDLTGDLPDVPVSALVLDPATSYLYIATDVGVFMSANDGAHWQPLGTGLPNSVVTGLAFYPTSRLLRAATHGRSMWDIVLPVPQPSITSAGFISSAYYGGPGSVGLVPGSIAAVYGSQMANDTESATAIPLPTWLGGSTLTIGTTAAPFFFVSPGQMNLQVPWETPVGAVNATLTLANQTSSSTVSVAQYAPGIYTLNSSGTGQGVITNLDNTWAAAVGSIPGVSATPAKPGGVVVIYCTGLGAVNNTPATGEAASANPLASTTIMPEVTIGGVPAVVLFSGLTPDAVGLYQIDALLASTVAPGNSVPVSMTMGGVASNTVTIAVAQ